MCASFPHSRSIHTATATRAPEKSSRIFETTGRRAAVAPSVRTRPNAIASPSPSAVLQPGAAVRLLSLFVLFACPCFVSAAPEIPAPPTDLVDYVTKKDDSFSWKLVKTDKTDAGTVYEIDLISQTWHDIKWDHKLQIFVHKDAKPKSTKVVWKQAG